MRGHIETIRKHLILRYPDKQEWCIPKQWITGPGTGGSSVSRVLLWYDGQLHHHHHHHEKEEEEE